MVYGTAWRILGCAADAEDVVQDVFLQVHQIQQKTPVRYWVALLRRLASCRALDRLRQRRKTVAFDGLQLASDVEPPDAALMERETADRLREAIAQAAAAQGRGLLPARFEEFSYQQIAEALSITPGAAAAALHKARAKLEAALTESVKRD